ncbi:hypothetical protein INS49_001181 [Diaporthe citri]|uniref:uncharacterized protein n=1 Tax=Diaporthe citri TaxID=83186 RepID=UPI001C80CE5E|nr:uncharacterized protein INS49_001181 [Diaporthe citri]KAG6367000.1 hypothetical protein INS49_001181 [Diaporthe citri]
MKFMSLCAKVPILRAILTSKFVLALIGPKTTDTRGIGPLMRLSKEAVSKRFNSDAKDQADMLANPQALHSILDSYKD